MASRTRIVVFTLALSVSGTSVAWGQSNADRDTARGLMEDGDTKRERGDLKGALKSYEAADTIMHVPSTGVEVARTQIALGLLLEAAQTVARVSRIPQKPNEPAPFVKARNQAEQMATELAARIPSLVVAVTGSELPPDITIDGEAVPTSDTPRKLNPGKHVVVARAGTEEKTQDVVLTERDRKTVTLDLKKAGVDSKPNGWKSDADGSSAAKPLMYGGFGVAAVGVGVGAITGLMSLSETSAVKKDCTNNVCPTSRSADIQSARNLGTVATVSFVVAGIGAGAGIVGVLLSSGKPERAEKKESRLTPVVGPTYVGLTGRF